MKWSPAIALVLVPWLGWAPAALAQDGGGEGVTEEGPKPALNQGWNHDYGLLLSLRNPFQNSGFLTGYRNYGVGLLYAFDSRLALRAALDVSRASDPYYERTSEVEQPDGTTTTTSTMMNRFGGPTSATGVSLGADLLVRGSDAAVAPYFGGGLALSVDYTATRYTDRVSVEDVRTVVDNHSTSVAAIVGGTLGIEWRVHRHFALFAEYGLGIEVVDSLSFENQTTIRDSRGEGTDTTVSRTSASQAQWLNLDTGLDQGALLGVIAFF